jgi:hypothetical protein
MQRQIRAIDAHERMVLEDVEHGGFSDGGSWVTESSAGAAGVGGQREVTLGPAGRGLGAQAGGIGSVGTWGTAAGGATHLATVGSDSGDDSDSDDSDYDSDDGSSLDDSSLDDSSSLVSFVSDGSSHVSVVAGGGSASDGGVEEGGGSSLLSIGGIGLAVGSPGLSSVSSHRLSFGSQQGSPSPSHTYQYRGSGSPGKVHVSPGDGWEDLEEGDEEEDEEDGGEEADVAPHKPR